MPCKSCGSDRQNEFDTEINSASQAQQTKRSGLVCVNLEWNPIS